MLAFGNMLAFGPVVPRSGVAGRLPLLMLMVVWLLRLTRRGQAQAEFVLIHDAHASPASVADAAAEDQHDEQEDDTSSSAHENPDADAEQLLRENKAGTQRGDNFTLLFTGLVVDGAVELAIPGFGRVSLFGHLRHLLAVVEPFVLVFGHGQLLDVAP